MPTATAPHPLVAARINRIDTNHPTEHARNAVPEAINTTVRGRIAEHDFGGSRAPVDTAPIMHRAARFAGAAKRRHMVRTAIFCPRPVR